MACWQTRNTSWPPTYPVALDITMPASLTHRHVTVSKITQQSYRVPKTQQYGEVPTALCTRVHTVSPRRQSFAQFQEERKGKEPPQYTTHTGVKDPADRTSQQTTRSVAKDRQTDHSAGHKPGWFTDRSEAGTIRLLGCCMQG